LKYVTELLNFKWLFKQFVSDIGGVRQKGAKLSGTITKFCEVTRDIGCKKSNRPPYLAIW
jgi:hypothetical protein